MKKAGEMKTGTVGDHIEAENANWSFGGNVCDTFDEHVSKSVPFYEQGHQLITQLSDFYIHEGSTCYDLGSSTGTLLNKIYQHNSKGAQYIGYDAEPGMVDKATQTCANAPNLRFLCDDLMNVEFEKSDFIIAYYTMQFVAPKNRQILFDRIYEALNWGGAFILFEKVRGPDARFQELTTSLYTDYKLAQGYSAEEILAKSRSLKGVLEPFSTQGNLDLLARAGFEDTMSIMKYICFEGFLAVK